MFFNIIFVQNHILFINDDLQLSVSLNEVERQRLDGDPTIDVKVALTKLQKEQDDKRKVILESDS